MSKLVIYNGNGEVYSPEDVFLKPGSAYEVTQERVVSAELSYYTLLGIEEEEFESTYFNLAHSYFALSAKMPVVGEPLKNFMFFNNSEWANYQESTPVVSTRKISSDTFEVHTQDKIFIVRVVI